MDNGSGTDDERRRRSGPSLRDVAHEAGVSMMTVSNVVRGAPGVAENTRRRVLEHIERLGYRPNASARHLRAGRSGVISFAVPSIESPYFANLARLVMDEAERHGWIVLVNQTLARRDQEARVLDGLGPTLIDGTIFFPRALGAKEVHRGLGGHTVVLLGDRAAHAGADAVVVDNVGAAREATQHLIDLGRRRVAAIGVERRPRSEMSKRRLTGYRSAIRRTGQRELVPIVDDYSRAAGAATMTALLEDPNPPDAVFCFADVLALGASYAALSTGLRVPDDIAIVGFDDIEDSRYSWPPLTTVRPDKESIARHAVDLLHARLTDTSPRSAADTPDGPEMTESTDGAHTIHAPHQLLIRGSSTAYA